MSTPTPPAPLPPEVYGLFSGPINAETLARIVNGLTTASANKVQHLYLMFHSTGGNVGEGITLYNLFRSLPFSLTLYNAGLVASIGVPAYLGAAHRVVTQHGMFMIHRTQVPYTQGTPAKRVQTVVDAALLDDKRTEAILREHITMPEELWRKFDHDDLYFSGEDAVKYGIAHEIGEFSPPTGARIYYV